MTFLTPWSALIAAAIALPLLLLLYFLRLRRVHLRVPSTLLWEQAFQDLQANAPFQKLRWSLLLALQLLLLLALLLALAQPVVRGAETLSSRIVLLIDQSASMNALVADAPGEGAGNTRPRTRLDLAKQMAREMIEDLDNADRPRQMMIIAFGSDAHVASSFESNRSVLLDSLRSIQPTDEQANFDAALQLAGAFAATRDEREVDQPQVVLLSDGGVTPAAESTGHRLASGRFTYVPVVPVAHDQDEDQRQPPDAAAGNNIGITSFSVRRDYEDPARVMAFARLVNAGPRPADVAATLWIDEEPVAAIRKTIPPASANGPGEASITQSIDLPGGAVLTLRHNHGDALAADDAAWIVLPAPSRPRIVLVHPDGAAADPFLHDLLDALEPQRLDSLSAEAFAAIDPQRIDSSEMYDLVVFDRVSATRLPGIGSISFGGAPAGLGAAVDADRAAGPNATTQPQNNSTKPEENLVGRHILSWDRQHPLMRSVSLDNLVYAGFGAFDLPPGATALAYGPGGPVIALVRTRGAGHVVVGFELLKSNWPLHVSSAVFMQNAVDYLTLARSGIDGLAYRAGDPLTVRAAAGAERLIVEGPERMSVPVEPGSTAALPPLRRAGLYAIAGAASPFDRLAVNVFSDVESDIQPRAAVTVNAETAVGRAGSAIAAKPLWPWLAAVAIVLMTAEWLIYCLRARGGGG